MAMEKKEALRTETGLKIPKFKSKKLDKILKICYTNFVNEDKLKS